MEFKDLMVGVVLFFVYFALLVGGSYGAYKYGRYTERRALTEALTNSVDSTCKECYNEGVRAGKKSGLRTCDDMFDKADGDRR